MKIPFLAIVLAATSFSSASFADTTYEYEPPRTEKRQKVSREREVEYRSSARRRRHDHNGDGRVGVREFLHIDRAVNKIKSKARSVRQHKPLQLFSRYLTIKRSGNKVMVRYCSSRMKRIFKRGPGCENLHMGWFSVNDLKSCQDTARDKWSGAVLNRGLDELYSSRFSYQHIKIDGEKSDYRRYLKQCQASLGGDAGPSVKKKPPTPEAAPPEEFKPIEETAPGDVKPEGEKPTEEKPAVKPEGELPPLPEEPSFDIPADPTPETPARTL